ncbi:TadE/TadG family type IV pilus assembly protein [Sphingorhabdus buctiana]|uniref:TadE/TadG family type IV pilus assembly protein n=1 Tax=Sphingorhabdus buctiana TaxID=1508805 RepID=A0ABW4MEF6_9SPHN
MRVRQFLHDTKGASAAEMALVLPLLLVLMFGPFELAHYFWTEHKVVKGVRDGARYASRLGFTNYTCSDLTNATLKTQVQEITRTGQVSGGVAAVPDWVNDDVTVAVDCPDAALDASGDTAVQTGIYTGMDNAPIVTVSTTVTYTSLFQTLGFDATDLTVSASSQSAVMGI